MGWLVLHVVAIPRVFGVETCAEGRTCVTEASVNGASLLQKHKLVEKQQPMNVYDMHEHWRNPGNEGNCS